MFFYKNPYYNPQKSHHRLRGFENESPTKLRKRDLVRWMFQHYRQKLPLRPTKGYEAFQQEWVLPFQLPKAATNYITWLGHSTVYIHTPDFALITDPVFSERVSPFSFMGPQRKTHNHLFLEDLPRLDLIMISHNHYDHLDKKSILSLLEKFPEVTIIVPLGLARWFHKLGIDNVLELDWWDYHPITGGCVTSVPAQHWSKRGLFDRNRSLWSGYIVEIAGTTIYFAGDTGYNSNLQAIGDAFQIDIGLIPIGAYEPRWFMSPQHISPKESVMLHQLLGIKQSIGIHWGVFELTDEPIDEPPRYLRKCLEKQQISPTEFRVLKMNESFLI